LVYTPLALVEQLPFEEDFNILQEPLKVLGNRLPGVKAPETLKYHRVEIVLGDMQLPYKSLACEMAFYIFLVVCRLFVDVIKQFQIVLFRVVRSRHHAEMAFLRS
jgi:hypothetical protein